MSQGDGDQPEKGEKEVVPAKPPAQQPARAAAIPDRQLIERFIENQAKEIAVRNSELELEKHRVDAGLDFSRESLKTQERDREAERQCSRRSQRDKLIAGLILVGIIAVFALIALYLNKEAVVIEFGKDAVLLVGGGAGGYGLGSRKKKSSSDNSPQSDDDDD